MTYLVTGGAGFIGSTVVGLLLDERASVVNVDKLTYSANTDILGSFEARPGYAFERIDISNAAAIAAVFARYQPNVVLHLAAESHVDRSIDQPGDFINTNIVGTYVMLEAARQYWEALVGVRRQQFRFVHVSTDEVYGSLGSNGAFDETSRYDPSSPYAATKAGSDHLARAWGRTFGLPVIVTNASNNFGPYQFPEKLMPLMIINALEGKPLPVYGDGQHVRDWLYVDDHARALLNIARNGEPGQSYNIGAGQERANIDVVRAICAQLDRLLPQSRFHPHAELIRFVEDRPGHDRRYALDVQKLARSINWRPRETFDSALEKTVRWYVDNRGWWQAIRTKRYGGERLGLPVG
jgi:dTDP-glucose 4,6-dehydratase